MKTLLIGNIHPEAFDKLRKGTSMVHINNGEFRIRHSFPGVEAIILRTFTDIGEAELNKLPHLRFIISCSVGLNNLDIAAVEARNIQLIYAPGSNANSVAEHTLYFLLNLLRNREPPFLELRKKTVGIIGLGHVGKLVAKKLIGFETRVIAFDVIEQDVSTKEELQVEMLPFDTVVQQADILTIHVPLNEHTKGLINRDVINKLKDGAYFINTSREEVVDEEALLENSERLGGIALDVCSEELKEKLDGIICTDHVAAQGQDSFREQCLAPIEDFLKRLAP